MAVRSALGIVSVFVGFALATTASAAPRNSDGKPSVTFSIANDDSPASEGILFKSLKAAFDAARIDNGIGFSKFVATNAELKLSVFDNSSIKETVFGTAVANAVTKSCVGPYPYDEGADWVQVSFVCGVDSQSPFARFLTFRDSPELILTAWYEGKSIKKILAMESLPVPGQRKVSMGAYESMQVQGKQQP